MPQSDDKLIEAFQQGDEFAFVALYNRYKGPVYAFCAKMLLDRSAAQDVMQEPFVVPPAADEAVFERIDGLRRTPRRAPYRISERRFFGGQIHRRVSCRSALLAAVVLIAFGLAVRPAPTPDAPALSYHVTETVIDDGALYVIGPGITVEDKRLAPSATPIPPPRPSSR